MTVSLRKALTIKYTCHTLNHLAITLLAFTALLLSACHEQPKAARKSTRDSSISPRNAYNNLFLDSSTVEQFITRDSMPADVADQFRNFYAARNYQYAWFDTGGLAEQAHAFVNLWQAYEAEQKDSALLNPLLQQRVDSLFAETAHLAPNRPFTEQTELLLTTQFFKYARIAFTGSQALNTENLQWFIPRKKIKAGDLLDSLISNKGKDVERYAPLNPQYFLLKDYLTRYKAIREQGGWATLPSIKAPLRLGTISPAITLAKKRLFASGDLLTADTTDSFDSTLQEAVRNFQQSIGLPVSGQINPATATAMNVPVEKRIEQLLLNMERLRWVPAKAGPDYLLVNIPDFRLFVYEKDSLAFSMGVVVGQEQHNTVIFTGNLKYIVFSPYWNIPPGILAKEVIPAVRKNPGYLPAHRMEVAKGNTVIPAANVAWSRYTGTNFPYTVRQKPGPGNSLGKVKFLFPNNYNIYLHDTPSKNLFSENQRAFSHGCIRLSEPQKLAEYLLRKDSSWTTARIVQAMNREKEQYVTLKQTVPVYIAYFTAWVDHKGRLNFRNDLYGHDARLATRLFTGSDTAAVNLRPGLTATTKK